MPAMTAEKPSPAAISPAAAASVTGTSASPAAARRVYPWLAAYDPADALAARFPRPAGYADTAEEPGSFGDWLRHLPLKKGNPPVLLFSGKPKPDQTTHVAVIDIDTGPRDLQQCADSIIRLRGEYLFATGHAADIHFNFTSGDRIDFSRWLEGLTPVVHGNSVEWARGQPRPADHATLRKYLDVVFEYAGTRSLAKELHPVASLREMRVGDVFISPGSPGHAVIVVDMIVADDPGGRGWKKLFMLAQGFMPAQDMHILRNPAAESGPWYDLNFGNTLQIPEWMFAPSDLKRF
jgi:hypothetical protein